ncbi:MAG: hypothetical protein EXS55_04535 [Candidatus Magasanikbacteria bacterium]|nr:hypothetical protein [Candidatus Magasanikbacteria bacterium]
MSQDAFDAGSSHAIAEVAPQTDGLTARVDDEVDEVALYNEVNMAIHAIGKTDPRRWDKLYSQILRLKVVEGARGKKVYTPEVIVATIRRIEAGGTMDGLPQGGELELIQIVTNFIAQDCIDDPKKLY